VIGEADCELESWLCGESDAASSPWEEAIFSGVVATEAPWEESGALGAAGETLENETCTG
jgi:hypothetical protein